ncbi:MAG: DNA polymerase ligase N-terminal domain-containing protein [Longimicrobiales bacterium]|nr:DNA polymerase ligase N-terminal domain-containing protein [Longimicrobiales bacterium]
MSREEPLKEYLEKRDFERTPEPEGGGEDHPRAAPIFVIQEHDASTHHFDVRLQVGDVLRSWAVPKGPSTDPSEKRLAVPTEDHPLEYAEFEGVIPEDEYGGGRVIVWDAGRYTNLKSDEDGTPVPVEDQLDDGHATVWLHGEKIRGGYAFVRTDMGDEERWLMVKMDDEEADARRKPVSTEPESVISGRTLGEVSGEREESREDEA